MFAPVDARQHANLLRSAAKLTPRHARHVHDKRCIKTGRDSAFVRQQQQHELARATRKDAKMYSRARYAASVMSQPPASSRALITPRRRHQQQRRAQHGRESPATMSRARRSLVCHGRRRALYSHWCMAVTTPATRWLYARRKTRRTRARQWVVRRSEK